MCNLKFANSDPQELNTHGGVWHCHFQCRLGTIRDPIGQQREQLLPVRERLGFFEPFCSPNWKGSVAKSLQKMGHWNSCGTILLLHNMNILPLLLGKSWYRECIHCISFHIAAHIISHRIWNPEGEWCSTSGAGTGWNQSWGNFQVSWAEIVVFVQCKSRWRTKSWESYYWLIGKFLYLRWFLTLANSFFIGKRVDLGKRQSQETRRPITFLFQSFIHHTHTNIRWAASQSGLVRLQYDHNLISSYATLLCWKETSRKVWCGQKNCMCSRLCDWYCWTQGVVQQHGQKRPAERLLCPSSIGAE